MPKKETQAPIIHKNKVFWVRFFSALLLFLVLVFSSYHLYYADKIIPGVHIGSLSLGGKDYVQARLDLEKLFASLDDSLILVVNDQNYAIPLEDIEFEVLWENTLVRLFEVGRSGNILIDSRDKAFGLVAPLKVTTLFTFNEVILSDRLAEVRLEVTIPPKSPQFILEEGRLEVTPVTVGRTLDAGALYQVVMLSLGNLDLSPIQLPLENDIPDLSAEDFLKVEGLVKKVIDAPLRVIHEESIWELDPSQKLELIKVVRKNWKVDLSLSEEKLDAFVEFLKGDINRQPRGKVIELGGSQVNFEIVEKGQGIDVENFKKDFEESFFALRDSVFIPLLNLGEPEDEEGYGISELLGEGNSYFYGSASGRIHNLTLAAERASGVLVPPGETFSLNESVGEISSKTGYNSAWIIANGKTILGEGGGVCQTSTTLFRAVLDAGLPVIERNPHAYRVVYYEYNSPIGHDAAIYQPSVDFKFKNDTENYILVQASWDLKKSRLTFKLFGTSDGREVEITDSVITNVTPPPEAKYEDDPNLPKGTVKQIDFEAWGAYVYFDRIVTRGDEVLYEDTFATSYRPWQAVYLRGTKE